MENQQSSRVATILAHSVEKGANAADIADAVISIWQEIDALLCPVIAHRGVVALYKRSLYLTIPAHPWLAGAYDGVHTPMDLATLKAMFTQQNNISAAAGGGAFLQIFYELLTSLIGTSLTEQLLGSVWANSFRGFPAQDTSP